MLARYQAWRRPDATLLALGMDGVNALFSNANPLLRAARGLGLGVVADVAEVACDHLGVSTRSGAFSVEGCGDLTGARELVASLRGFDLTSFEADTNPDAVQVVGVREVEVERLLDLDAGAVAAWEERRVPIAAGVAELLERVGDDKVFLEDGISVFLQVHNGVAIAIGALLALPESGLLLTFASGR